MSQTTPPLFFNAEWLSMQQRFWENTFKFNPQQPSMPDVLGLWNSLFDNMRKQMSGWIESPFQKVDADAQNFSKLFEQFQSYMQQFPTWQSQFQTGAQLWQNHQQAQQAALQMVQKIGTRAISLLNQRIEELSNQQPLPPQALYTAWVESGEEAYAEFVSTEDYSKITGELINSWLAWQHNGRIALDEMLANLHLPTYAQTQKLQTKLAELRSQQAALQHADNTAEINSLTSEISRLQNIISELQTAKATPVEIVVEKPVEVIVEKVVEKTNDAEIARLQGVISTLEETIKAKPTEVVKEVVIEKIVEKTNDAEIVSLNAEIIRLQNIISEFQAKTVTAETHEEIKIEEPVKKKTTRKSSSTRSNSSFKIR
jgi:ribosomal protein L29